MDLVILASGRGTNFEAIAEAVQKGVIPDSRIVALVTNRPGIPALEIAKRLEIPTITIDHKAFALDGKQRHAYEQKLLQTLCSLKFDYLVLAGYMLILGEQTVEKFKGRILNIHPSLLPKYKGLHPHRQALEAGEKETGCTVHFVTNELDAGPIVSQRSIRILRNDTEETLSARLLPLEHETYVKALAELAKQGKR